MIVVSNTSPITNLAAIGQIDLFFLFQGSALEHKLKALP
jgi:predicted nucleic acid-binding protein